MAVSDFALGSKEYVSEQRIPSTSNDEQLLQQLASFFAARVAAGLPPVLPKDPMGDLGLLLKSGVGRELAFASTSIDQLRRQYSKINFDPRFVGGILLPYIPDLTIFDESSTDRELWSLSKTVVQHFLKGSSERNLEELVFNLTGIPVDIVYDSIALNSFSIDLEMSSTGIQEVYQRLEKISKIVGILKPAHFIFNPRIRFSESLYQKKEVLPEVEVGTNIFKPFLSVAPNLVQYSETSFFTTGNSFEEVQYGDITLVLDNKQWNGSNTPYSVFILREAEIVSSTSLGDVTESSSILESSVLDPVGLTIRGSYSWEEGGIVQTGPALFILDALTDIRELGKRIPAKKLGTILGASADRLLITKASKLEKRPKLRTSTAVNLSNTWLDNLPNQVLRFETLPSADLGFGDILLNRRYDIVSYQSMSSTSPYAQSYSVRDRGYYQSNGIYLPISLLKSTGDSVTVSHKSGTGTLIPLGGYTPLLSNQPLLTVIHKDEFITLSKFAMLTGSYNTLKPSIVSQGYLESASYPGDLSVVIEIDLNQEYPAGLSADLVPGTNFLKKEFTRLNLAQNKLVPFSVKYKALKQKATVVIAKSPAGSSSDFFYQGYEGSFGLIIKASKTEEQPNTGILSVVDEDSVVPPFYLKTRHDTNNFYLYSELPTPNGVSINFSGEVTCEKVITDYDKPIVVSRFQEDVRKNWAARESRLYSETSSLVGRELLFNVDGYTAAVSDLKGFTAIKIHPDLTIDFELDVESGLRIYAQEFNSALPHDSKVLVLGTKYLPVFKDLVSGELSSSSYDLILRLMDGLNTKAFYVKNLETGEGYLEFPTPVTISGDTYAEVVGIRLKPIYVGTTIQDVNGVNLSFDILSKSLQSENREISYSSNQYFGLGSTLFSTVSFTDEDLPFNTTLYSNSGISAVNYSNSNTVLVKNAPILNGSSGVLTLADFNTVTIEAVGTEGPYLIPNGTQIDPESGKVRLTFFPPFTQESADSYRAIKSSTSISTFTSIEGSEFSFSLDGQATLDSDGVQTLSSYILDEEEDPGVPLINSVRFPKIIKRKFRAFENNRTTLMDSADTLSLDKSGSIDGFSIVYSSETAKTINPEQEFYNSSIAALSSERAGVVPFFLTDCSKPTTRVDQNFEDVGPSAEDNGYTLYSSVEFRDPTYSGNVLLRDSVDLANKGRYLQYGDVDSSDWENLNRKDVLHTLSSIEVFSTEEGEDIRLTSLTESSKGMELYVTYEEDYYPDREFRVNNYKDYFKEIGREVFLRSKVSLVNGSTDITIPGDIDYSGYYVEIREIGGPGTQVMTIRNKELSRAFTSFSGKLVEKVFIEVYNPVIVDPYLECSLSEVISYRDVTTDYTSLEINMALPEEEIPLGGQILASATLPILGVGSYSPAGFQEPLCLISSHTAGTSDEAFKANLRSLTDTVVVSPSGYVKGSFAGLAATCTVAGNTVAYLLEKSLLNSILQQEIDFTKSKEVAEFICSPAGADPHRGQAKTSFNLVIAVKTEQPVTNPTGISQVRTIKSSVPSLINKGVWHQSQVKQIDVRIYTGDYIKYENSASGKFTGISSLGLYGWGGSRVAVKASYIQSVLEGVTGDSLVNISSNLSDLDNTLLLETVGETFKIVKALLLTGDGYLILELDRGLTTNKRNIPAKFFAIQALKAGSVLEAGLLKVGSSIHTKDYVVSVTGVNVSGFLQFKSLPDPAGILAISREASVITGVSNTRGVNLNSVFRKFMVEDLSVTPISVPGLASEVLRVASIASCYNWAPGYGKNQVRIPFPAVMLEEGDLVTIGSETRWVVSYSVSGSDLILTLNDEVKFVSAAGSMSVVPEGFCVINRVHTNSAIDPKFTHVKVGENFYPLAFKSDAISGGIVIAGEGLQTLRGSLTIRLTKVFTGYFQDPSVSPYAVQGPRSWDGSGPTYKRDRSGEEIELVLNQTAMIDGSGNLVTTPSPNYTVKFLDNPGEVMDLSNTNPLVYPYFTPMTTAEKNAAALKLGISSSDFETYLENPSRYFYKLVKWRNWDQMAVTPIGSYSDSTPWVVALRSWAKFL